ncbi:unnamed protein product [Microthlaspi erraticum]|uniref:F-box domain-containing protein n=1 Tax=Microthlaspi erraticum TaxID=1685480 RepID=A0A6D2JTX6_9BRAS|nr:unnamed protein product [Microthlaspi erraticum]
MVSSSSSPSFKKSSHKAATKISLNSLPNDLLVEISLHVASSSITEIHNLQLVSKSCQRFCNDRYVFHRLSLREIPLFPWHHHNRANFSKFFNRCLKNENPEALYRQGLIDCFHLDNNDEQNNINRGIACLSKAAKKGNQEAQFVYGMILICLAEKTKQKGFKILSSLIKPSLSSTVKELEEIRQKVRDNVLWRGKPKMKILKSLYVHENCNCDGRTKKFLAKQTDMLLSKIWFSNGEDNNDMVTSSACETCLWHHQLQLFFDDI